VRSSGCAAAVVAAPAPARARDRLVHALALAGRFGLGARVDVVAAVAVLTAVEGVSGCGSSNVAFSACQLD
jgi:hypothetical protein